MADGGCAKAAARKGASGGPASDGTKRRPLGGRGGSTLAGRLFALVAAVGFPLLLLAGWSAWTAHDGIRRQAEQSLLQRLRGIAVAVEREFDRAEALLHALAASSALARGDLGPVEEEMRAASRVFDGLPVTLAGTGGTVLRNTAWPPGAPVAGVPVPAEARRIIAGGRPGVTDLFAAPVGRGQIVSIVVPLQGSPVAASIGLSFPRGRLAEVLRTASGLDEEGVAAGWTASVLDRAGISVARTGGEEGVVGRPARPEVLTLLASAEEGLMHGLTTREGVPIIAAFHRSRRSGYAFILTTPLADFTAPLNAALLRTAVAGGLVVLFGFGFAALLARHTVEAFRAARAAASGRAPPARSGLREADELARAIAEAGADRHRAEAALTTSERRNREVLESLGERLYSLDAEGRVRFASRAALEGWGVTAEALLHRRFEEVFPRNTSGVTWQATREALVTRQEVHLCGISPLIGVWVEIDAYPSADGGLTVAFRDVEELRRAHLERARAAAALRVSEERLRVALEVAELGTWEVDLRAGTVRRSPRALAIFGFGPEAEVEPYPAWRGRMHPEDRDAAVGPIDAAIAGRIDAYRVEYRHQRPDGTWVWVESHGRVVGRDPATGRALRLAGTSRDVTERRAAEERQTLLAREVDHRAKNALAVVQAAVRLTPKEDAPAFARAIEGRVNALARAQTLLAADRWSSADLRGLIEGELSPFLGAEPDRPAAILSGPRVALPAHSAQPLAMAVHELATNAVKHGALSRQGGQVLVYWTLETGETPPRLRLRWVERGGPAVEGAPGRRGFGSRVLEGTVRGQLGGELEIAWERSGLVCAITIPLRRPAAAEEAA